MKILLLRQDRLGDLLISTGIIKNLKILLPNSEIHILLGNKNYFAKHLIEKYVNKSFLYDKHIFSTLKLIYKLKLEKYDLIIDLFDNPSKTSELFIKILNPKKSLGLEKSNSQIYTNVINLKSKFEHHIIDRVGYLLTAFTSEDNLYQMNFSPLYNLKNNYEIIDLLNFNNHGKTLLINLFGSNESKFWGVDNNINLINMILKNTNINILISTTPDKNNYLNNIISQINNSLEIQNRLKIIPYNKDLDYISKIISQVDLVLTPDTSIVHISAAFKTKCIILYPDTELVYGGKYWTPYNSPYIALNSENGDLTNIKINAVFESIYKMLYS